MKKNISKILIISSLFFLAIDGLAQSVGIGTTTPNSNSILELNSTSQGLLPPRMSGLQRGAMVLGASDYGMVVYDIDDAAFYYWNGAGWSSFGGVDSDWVVAGSDMYTGVNGNVGVGINAPGIVPGMSKYVTLSTGLGAPFASDGISLELHGGSADGSTPQSKIEFISKSTLGTPVNTARIEITNTAGSTIQGIMRFYTKGSSLTEQMTILNTGEVGIGVNNPTALLSVGSDANISPMADATVLLAQDGGDSYFETWSGDMSEGLLMRGSGNYSGVIKNIYSSGYMNGKSNNSLYIFNKAAEPIIFETGDAEIMRINDNGFVGIGNSAPNEKLTLDGVLSVRETGALIGPTANYGKFWVNSGNNHPYFSASDGSVYDLTAGDGDGIYGGSGTVPVGTAVTLANNINFDANTFYIDGTNNRVGVGTNSPSEMLEVNGGNVEITSSANQYMINNRRALNMSGTQALYVGENGASGNYTTAVGYQAGNVNAGVSNTFIGRWSGLNNIGGTQNTFLGLNSGRDNVGGSNNTYLGRSAGETKTGNGNTIVGYYAGNLAAVTAGSGLTLIGNDSEADVDGLTNATAIGSGSRVSASNSLILGEGANVGIGTSSPANLLDVDGISTSTSTTTGGLINAANSSTTGGVGIVGRVSENNATASGTRVGVAGIAWYGQSINRGGYFYGYGGTTSYGVYAYSSGAATNYGIYAYAPVQANSYAGYFNGDTRTSGEIQRNQTADANMVPIAYGCVSSGGGKYDQGSTSNWTVELTGTGTYEIAITGENVYYNEYVVVANANVSSPCAIVNTNSSNGNVQVRTFNCGGGAQNFDFQFVVYKP